MRLDAHTNPNLKFFNSCLESFVAVVEIYTDGACRGNPGPGGWGAVLRSGKHEKELYGGEMDTTNNRMEMTAVVNALNALKQPSDVTLTTDSQYVRKGITEWIHNWKKNGWKTAAKKDVKNADLWQQICLLYTSDAADE